MEFLWPLASFAFVASITPGPNNVMLAASGVAFGLQRTVPHMLGVSVGFAVLLLVCGSSVGAVVAQAPTIGLLLKVLGSAYLLYLAYAMRNALVPKAATSGRPLKFTEAALFQFVNPKAWLIGLTAVSVFVPDMEPRWMAVGIVVAVFILVGFPCICTWAAAGATLRHWMSDARVRGAVSATIMVLMVYSVVGMWMTGA
ncbi:MAG TPA: LysE family translocator [Gammaproteobacteria bacterium]